jgi:hypothetical protein
MVIAVLASAQIAAASSSRRADPRERPPLLFAIDAKTGDRVWSADLGEHPGFAQVQGVDPEQGDCS